ncbi:MAG TPA: NlpC/P60 family protein [Prosthecobacter sp.]
MKTLIPILLLALAGSGLALAESVPKKKSGTTSKSKSSASSSAATGKSGSGSAKSKSGGSTGSKSGSSSSASSSSSSNPQGAGKDKAGEEGKASDKKNAPLEAVEDVAEGPESGSPRLAAVSSVEPEEIDGFDSYAPQIQALIRKALGLTKLNLTYTFGSADPKRGGMDCSGTIYFLLHDFGFKDVPRSSDGMCGWVQDRTLLHRIQKADSLDHAELSALQPGNLIFWSGTYATAPRKIPVTHVMLYLGKLKKGGKPVVFGASDGRSYQGQRRTGVSVFDFTLPRSGGSAALYGYGLIPGVGKIEVTPAPVEVAKAETDAEAASAPGSESAAGEDESSSSGQRKAGGDGLDRSKSKAGAANQVTDGGAKAVKNKAEGKGGETDGADDAPPSTSSSSSAIKPGGQVKAGADAVPASSPAAESTPKPVPESKPSQVSGSKPKPKSGETSSTRKKSTGSRTGAGGSGTKRSGASPASSSSSSSSGASQSPLSRARSAAGGFLEEVRRALPAGR